MFNNNPYGYNNRRKSNGLFKNYDRTVLNRVTVNNARLRNRYLANRINNAPVIVQNPRPFIPYVRPLKPEVKTVDSLMNLMQFSTDSTVANCMLLLNTVPTGNSAITRIGKKVAAKAIQIRGTLLVSTATKADNVALMLVWIKTPNLAATLPAVTEILKTQHVASLTNRDNASKFKIVRRWNYVLTGNQTTPSTGTEEICIDEYVTLKPSKYESVWSQGSVNGTIGEFEKGALILLCVGEEAYNATTTVTIYGNTRYFFVDV